MENSPFPIRTKNLAINRKTPLDREKPHTSPLPHFGRWSQLAGSIQERLAPWGPYEKPITHREARSLDNLTQLVPVREQRQQAEPEDQPASIDSIGSVRR